MLYIVGFGVLMMYLHLLVGGLAIKTRQDFQLVRLAECYAGVWGRHLMMVLMYLIVLGALVVYIIGTGEALAALLPGSALLWSVIFLLYLP